MAPYRPIYLTRSDGKLEILSKSRKKESNAPTADQLDSRPDAKGNTDYFKELELGDAKEVDWRRKLGGMLIREIGGQEHPGSNYILAALPENYRLYERVKSGLVSEVTDAYLYGHPQGRKKRYRSPGDFFPHLLWLATDDNGDPDNCSCKLCAPDDLQVFKEPDRTKPPEPVKKEQPPIKKEAIPPKPSAIGTRPMVIVPSRSHSEDKGISVTKPPASKPPSATLPPTVARQAGPPPATPTLLAPAKCFEQDQDSQWNKYLFRPGELAWFNRGNAWGLSVILKRTLERELQDPSKDRAKYLVQPLSNPLQQKSTKIIESEDGLRPWLAWSPPLPTHSGLANTPGLTYSTIDWKGVTSGHYGQGDAEVDGSIFAAKAVDDSLTLFHPLTNNTVTTGERTYNGIYLGGEKIWTGEPIRLRVGSGQDIMVVHSIVERLKPGSTSISSATVLLVGDIYKFSTLSLQPGDQPPDNRHLPLRLRQDMECRNRVTIRIKRTMSFWKLAQAQARLPVTDIKGRWYESSALLPILKGADAFSQDLTRGEIGDAGQWMNARGDCNIVSGVPPKAGTRVVDRLDAFGKSIPPGTKISKGLDGPPEDQAFPKENAMPPTVQQHVQVPMPMEGVQEDVGKKGLEGQGVSDGDIEQFMDLDRLEDGYVQQFTEAGGQF
ncbi:MAG: hypothetical protein L6R42_003523 [Xanthoria sp. 1 TBL-2021]|nr:MAG: hypothetical protein L6R42_003523 [Xanthoria sp. 1 TBL-2021]